MSTQIGGFHREVAFVIGLYDDFSNKPVDERMCHIYSTSGNSIVKKGNGIFVLIKNKEEEIKVRIESKIYQNRTLTISSCEKGRKPLWIRLLPNRNYPFVDKVKEFSGAAEKNQKLWIAKMHEASPFKIAKNIESGDSILSLNSEGCAVTEGMIFELRDLKNDNTDYFRISFQLEKSKFGVEPQPAHSYVRSESRLSLLHELFTNPLGEYYIVFPGSEAEEYEEQKGAGLDKGEENHGIRLIQPVF